MGDTTVRMHALVMDCAEFEGQSAFWRAALGYVDWFAPFGQFVGIRPPVEDGRLPIIFQRVPEPKAGKNRVHMDYETTAMAAEVRRLTGLGATAIAVRDLGPDTRWTVMADTEGNEFCVTQAAGAGSSVEPAADPGDRRPG